MAATTLQGSASIPQMKQAAKSPSAQKARGKSKAKTKGLPQGFKRMNTQMNVRIEADLKERGDRVFACLGYTPSEIVRALWSYADRHGNNLEDIRTLLSEIKGEDAIPSTSDRIRSMQEARQTVSDFFRTWNLKAGESKQHEKLDEYLDALREEETLSTLRNMGYNL